MKGCSGLRASGKAGYWITRIWQSRIPDCAPPAKPDTGLRASGKAGCQIARLRQSRMRPLPRSLFQVVQIMMMRRIAPAEAPFQRHVVVADGDAVYFQQGMAEFDVQVFGVVQVGGHRF